MIDIIGEYWTTALFGAVGGLVLGLAARLGRFCTMGAIEDLLYGGSDIRMRMWVLAIGVGILGCFGLTGAGMMQPEASYYLSIRWMPLASILGGLTFGYGMALAGNCGLRRHCASWWRRFSRLCDRAGDGCRRLCHPVRTLGAVAQHGLSTG